MRRKPVRIGNKINLNLGSIGDLFATTVVRNRFHEFLDDIGAPEDFTRVFLKAFDQWANGREFTPDDRDLLVHAGLKDCLHSHLKSENFPEEDIDAVLSCLDDCAQDYARRQRADRPFHYPTAPE